MKMSTEILLNNLETMHNFRTHGIIDNELVLLNPRFLQNSTELQDNYVYLMEQSCKICNPSKKTKSVLLFIGDLPSGYSDFFDAIFEFDRGLSLFDLHNELQDIYAKYEEWDEQLQRILNSGGSVQEMIDCSEAIFRNPLLLHNRKFVSIARTGNNADNANTPHPIEKGSVIDIDYLSTFKIDAEYNKTYCQVNATIFPAHITGFRSLYKNIFIQGSYQYRLLAIESKREFQFSDRALLEHLSYYVELVINQTRSDNTTEIMTLQHVLKKILTGDFTDPYYIEQKLNEYNWYSYQNYLCIKVLLDVLDIQNHTFGFLCDRIAILLAGSCVFEYDKSIVVYVNLDIFGGDTDKAISSILYFLRDCNLKVGISNQFKGLSELRLYYRQAEIALNIGLRNKPHIWNHRFQDITELFLLESCTSQLPTHMVCAPEIGTLREFDDKHNTEYCRTLLTYLKNNYKQAQTCKELFIHRSTFTYRLERIQELVGNTIENRSRQWYLLLSYKLLEQPDHTKQ